MPTAERTLHPVRGAIAASRPRHPSSTRPTDAAPDDMVHAAHDADGHRDAKAVTRWPVSEQVMRHIMACLERIDAADLRPPRRRRRDLQRAVRLRRQLPCVVVECDPQTAAVGRRISVGTETGEEHSWWLALPGDESATAATVSITSPVGRALAGTTPGDTVYLPGAGGAWAVVLDVTGPR